MDRGKRELLIPEDKPHEEKAPIDKKNLGPVENFILKARERKYEK